MLLEFDDQPQSGLAVARIVAGQHLAVAELRGPQSAVVSVHFMPGEREIAAVTADGTLFLWNRDGIGEPRRSPIRTGGRPVGLSVSSDGRLIATATHDRRAITWAPEEGRAWEFSTPANIESIIQVPGEAGPVVITDEGSAHLLEPGGRVHPWMPFPPSIAIVQALDDGRLIASTRQGEIWHRPHRTGPWQRLDEGTPAMASDFPFNGERYAAFSKDGEWYAIAFQDRVLLRSVRHSNLFRVFERKSSVCCLAFDSGSRRLAAAGADGVTTIWNVSDGQPVATLDSGIRFWRVNANIPVGSEPDSFSVQQIAFAPDASNRIAVLTSDSIVRIWSIGGGNPAELRGHIGADSLVWGPTGKMLATGADVGTVRVWTTEEVRDPIVLRHPAAVDGAVLTADNTVVSVAGGVVREFSAEGKPVETRASWPPASALGVSRDRHTVVAGFENGTVRIRSGQPSTWSEPLSSLTGRISKVVVNDTHLLVMSGRTAAIVNLRDIHDKRVFALQGADVFSVDLAANGKEFVTGNDDGAVVRYGSSDNAKFLQSADGKTVYDVDYSPDQRRVLTCSQNGSAVLYTLSALPVAKPLAIDSNGEWIETCAFSSNGGKIVVTGSSGRAWITDANGLNARALRRANGVAHVGSVLTIGFSGDSSRVLLTGGVDGQATVWDTVSGNLVSVLSGHEGTIIGGEISTDGTRLLTASHDGTVRLWSGDWKTIIERLRRRTTATLDPEKRMNALGETERQAWEMFRRRESAFGRKGVSYGPFAYPF
jgi:WD40 repeat protein